MQALSCKAEWSCARLSSRPAPPNACPQPGWRGLSPYDPQDSNLELYAVALPAILLDPRVDKLHQGVPLHQHVGEG